MNKLFALLAAVLLCSGATAKTPVRLATEGQISVSAPTTQSVAGAPLKSPSLQVVQGDLLVSLPRTGSSCPMLALVKVADMSRAGSPWSVITTAAPLEKASKAGQPSCTGLVKPDELAGVLRPSANVLAWAELESASGGRHEYLALRNSCRGEICTLVAAEPQSPVADEPIAPSPNQHAGVIGESIKVTP